MKKNQTSSNDAWFSVSLGDALLSQPILNDLNQRLSLIYDQQGRPKNMAAAYRHVSKGLHCHLVVFLTADFQQFIKLENAVRCNLPSFMDISFLAGNSACVASAKASQ